MRQITKINPVDKKRFEIYLDGKLAFVLYKGELRSFNINEDSILSEEDYEQIINTILPKRALLRCGHLLEKRDYTENQLRSKLIMAKYPEESIEYALDKVKGYGFVDDYRYATRYIESNINKISLNAIRTKLYQKGIKKEIIDKAVENTEEFLNEDTEKELIIKLLTKRHYYDSSMDSKEKNKQYNYLISKGFARENIVKCLKCQDDM